MNNFGVIEVASTRTTHAPGWAYVPDTGINPAAAALQPTNRKRARNQTNPSASDLTARQDAKIRKELEALDRDNLKDVNIVVPQKSGGTRAAQHKSTANVRKILQSQKTFANHLDDYQAMLALAETNPAVAAALNATNPLLAPPAPPPPPPPASSSSSRRPPSKKQGKQAASSQKKAVKEEPPAAAGEDVTMADAPATDAAAGADGPSTTTDDTQQQPQQPPQPSSYPAESSILPAYHKAPPQAHAGDADPLLLSRVPPMPPDDELRALMTAPPLSYGEAAQGRWGWAPAVRGRNIGTGDADGDDTAGGGRPPRYPVRVFCAVCGYWGRVKCMKCGARVCALDCLEVHREECVTRYGL